MKKILLTISFFLLAASAQAAVDSSTGEIRGGYVGELPDVTQSFQTSRPAVAKPKFEAKNGFDHPSELKPVPRDNPAFVNIILKKDKTSQYVNDINQLLPIMEKLITQIEEKENLQRFAATAHYFNNHVSYIRSKYEHQSEGSYLSFKKLMEVNLQTQTVTTLRSESQAYNKYLAYSDLGYIYNPNNVEQQLEYLLVELKQTVIILKEVN